MSRALSVFTSVLLLAAACGGAADRPEATDEVLPEMSHLEFTVTGSKGAWTVKGPAQAVQAGVYSVDIVNETDAAVPSAEVIRLDEGGTIEKVAEFLRTAEGPIPSFLHPYGGLPNVEPKQIGSFVAALDAGSYIFASFDRLDEEDEKSPQLSDKGLRAAFSVTGSSTETLPPTVATVTAREYEFVPENLKAGPTAVTFRNVGKEVHHAVLFKIVPGKTADDVKKTLEAGEDALSGPPPFEEETGDLWPTDGGESHSATLELKKGDYVIVCFINDRAGGAPHFTKGMFKPVTIA